MSIEDAQELYEFLQGKQPETLKKRFLFKAVPDLAQDQAFAVIYYLQEHLGLIPDIYEKCGCCGRLYDSGEEGMYSLEKEIYLCEDCMESCDGE
ncbi:MAG: hypothetical protein IJ733_13395 [Lachnospiraceae bacterium]|nr:hypothetical protein [Lachnospiraceae bacterium]